MWGRGCGYSGPRRLSGARGRAAGVRHFNPLALTSHLPPPPAKLVAGPPLSGLGGWRLQAIPFLGGLWVSPLHPSPPLPRKVHFLQCVQRGSLPWVWSRRVGAGGGWGGLLCRGVGLGGNCIDFSSQAGRCGAERPSPEPAQHTHWGGWRSRDRPTDRRTDRPQDPPEKESAMCPCPPVTPGVSHTLFCPCPVPAHPGLHGEARPASGRRCRWGRGGGEVALLGALPRGAWARAPGCAHLPEQQREMNNLGRPLCSTVRHVRTSPRPSARRRVAAPSPEEWQVQPQWPESLKLCRLYLLSSCLGGFICMILFFPFVFYLLFFFFGVFFPFFSSCVDVSVCFVFSAGLGVGGAFSLALTFHRKRGPGVGCAAPPGTKEQGVGRNPSYPRYQDCA